MALGLVGTGLAGFRKARRRTEPGNHSGGRMGRAGESPVCEVSLLYFPLGVFMSESRQPGGQEEGEKQRVVSEGGKVAPG